MTAPTLIDVVFAHSGDKTAVPDAIQGDGSVSFEQGYGIDYSTPVASGGINIERDKMNYLLNVLFAAVQQYQFHGTPDYYAAIGAGAGYAKYAEVLYGSPAKKYQSLIDANADLPTNTASWFEVPLGGNLGFSTGDLKPTLKATADTGWVMMNDGTIGNASSSATTRANADTQALFTLLWNNVSNTYAPVSGGRGASAIADFNANKTIGLTKVLGRALAVAGTGSGLSARTLGQTFGEEAHTPTLAEMFPHTHVATVTDPGHTHQASSFAVIAGQSRANSNFYHANTNTQGNATTTPEQTGSAPTGISVSNASQGSGTAFNVMQPTSFVNIMIKL